MLPFMSRTLTAAEAQADGGDEHSPQPLVGRRERKKLANRRAIARAALLLAVEHGPDGITIDQISEAADVSPRTFFNHFGSKEDAILHIDPRRAVEVRDRLAARPPEEPPLQALREALSATSVSMSEAGEEWNLRMTLVREHPALFPAYVAQFAALERGLVETVAVRTGLDADADLFPSLVVASAIGAMRVTVNKWQAMSRARSLEDLVDESFALLAAGLEPPAAAT
jgi:AcrR family transcriptional regulator